MAHEYIVTYHESGHIPRFTCTVKFTIENNPWTKLYNSFINLEVLESRELGNAFVGNTLTGKDASLTANLYVQRTVVFYFNISNST